MQPRVRQAYHARSLARVDKKTGGGTYGLLRQAVGPKDSVLSASRGLKGETSVSMRRGRRLRESRLGESTHFSRRLRAT